MNKDDWEKAKEIFAIARRLPPESRPDYLADACSDDADVRSEVESLLASLDGAESFMEAPAVAEVAEFFEHDLGELRKGTLVGHYEIIEQLGEGGMGEVYLAKDPRLDRKVALKLLSARTVKDEERTSRFHQEALATSALNHPNIVTIHEIGEWQGRHFIATEYVEGVTLRHLMSKKGLSIGEAVGVTLEVASALAASHSAGVIHRDVKPENIMIRADGLVKVLDFGVAKYTPARKGREALVKTGIGEIIGTAAYMSPEQARGLEVDERTDIWSTGVVLYEMLARKLPFPGETRSDRIAAILEREPPPLNESGRKVPTELERIIKRALAKNRDERYPDVLAMIDDLSGTSAAPKSDRPRRLVLPASRKEVTSRNLFLYAALTLLIVGGLLSAYYLQLARDSSPIAAGRKSLAVLPFVNASENPESEYLSDGISESIINNLSQLSDLRVMSRSSAFRFKNARMATSEIASQLGVGTIVTGDIQKIGDRFVINVRLIDGKDDSQIWGDQFVKTNADVIAAQNEIAQVVANNLRLKLSNAEQQQLAKRYTENAEAYQLYLKGRYHTFKLTPSDVQKGIAHFQQAIEIDPNYALAYAGLSDAYRAAALSGAASASEIMPRAKAAATKALEIDDRLVEAHTSLSSIIFWYDWDWGAAENQLKRALQLDPRNADAHIFYAYLLSNTGRHVEALAEAKLARELDPLSLVINALDGQFLLHAGRTDDAIDRLQKTIEMDPKFSLAHSFAASAYIEKGMYDEAIAAARQAREANPVSSQPAAFLCFALVKSGKHAEARKELEELLNAAKTQYVSPYDVAMIYGALNDRERSHEWLEQGLEQRDARMTFLKVEPKWRDNQEDPRFVSLLRRMRLE